MQKTGCCAFALRPGTGNIPLRYSIQYSHELVNIIHDVHQKYANAMPGCTDPDDYVDDDDSALGTLGWVHEKFEAMEPNVAMKEVCSHVKLVKLTGRSGINFIDIEHRPFVEFTSGLNDIAAPDQLCARQCHYDRSK